MPSRPTLARLQSLPTAALAALPDPRRMVASAAGLRRVMNAYPPFLFAGIHVQELSEDYRHTRVRLRLNPATANYVGTQYGGSLYSMTDPFWMIMVMRNLGDDYVVWDKAAEIEFVSPGRSDVTTEFTLTQEVLDELVAAAADGGKVLRWFDNEVVDGEGRVVARVRKQLYVRRKPAATGAPSGGVAGGVTGGVRPV